MRARRITTILTLTLTAVMALPALAQRGDDSKRKSKNGRTEGTIGGVAVTVEYGRPSVAGRRIWGELVPYGKVWRTGADEATTITFSKEVMVEGQKLAAGTYGLFTVPGETEWTVVFNRVAKQWGAYEYDDKQDALRVKVAPTTGDPIEALDFVIEGDRVVMRWEKARVGFRVAPA
jgi:hypothetical protein